VAELNEAFGAEAVLHAGDDGIYDVVVDGTLVFSKHEAGRFPDDGEIVALVKAQR